ncbi:hypothetical protein ACRAWD_30690 [Caulobacter segnis]
MAYFASDDSAVPVGKFTVENGVATSRRPGQRRRPVGHLRRQSQDPHD